MIGYFGRPNGALGYKAFKDFAAENLIELAVRSRLEPNQRDTTFGTCRNESLRHRGAHFGN